MVRLGRKADKQWRFVGQDVKDVQDLTLAHIRAVYGLGSAALDGQGNSKESADETDSADASVNVSIFPYCGNRYDRTDVEDFSRSKGTSTTCSAARCKDGNPHCLNYMGQDQWENDDAFDKYFAERARGPNPELALRPKDTPAGMKNLGATCYANSLLQVWFHDLAFRNAIYQCHFEQNGDKSMNALYQLQLLFAHLDRGSKEFYNPQSLIASLKLDTTMQQDAQEFCNLFMARIDNQLQRQPKEHLGRFVNDQFQGHYSYNTTCKRCKKTSVRDCTFYELLLNIKDNCTLMDCLEEFVEPEELTGADQYSCLNCGSLQDASREIKIDKLPPVLNIQMMRFVYDIVTWTKKKSKDNIRFPEIIDFSELLEGKKDMVYELRAVLIHSGPSAHSGHFLAHVRSQQRDKWFVLNDEEVAEFHGSKFDAEDYSEAESKPKAKKKATIDKGREAEKNLNILSSRNAYMLTYTKVDSKSPVAPNAPPVEALDIVLQDNANLFNEVEEYTRYKESVKLDFEKARAERRELYRCWNVNSDEDDRFYVSAPTLSSYIYLGGGTRTVLDNSSIACQHGKLCPNAVVGSKAISQAARHVLEDQHGIKLSPLFTADDFCEICTKNTFQDKLYSIVHRRDTEEFERKAKGSKSPAMAWVSKSWVTDWLKVSPRFHTIHCTAADDPSPLSEAYASDVLCPHSSLSPDRTKRRLINKAAMEVLQRTFGPLDLPGTDALECDVCRDQLQPHVDNLKEMMARASSEKSELVELMMRGARVRQMQPSRKYYAVSIDGFMRKWLDFVKKPASHARPGAIDNSGLLCKHDLFIFDLNNAADAESDDDLYIVNEEEWAYFRAIYGGGPEIVLTRTEAMDTDGNVVVFHLQSAPDVCCTCRNERILDFSCTTLLIRVFNSGETADGLSLSKADPFTPTGEDASCVAHPTAVQKLKRKQQPASAIRPEFLGTRRSKRSKTTKTPYKEIKILVSKWETVMELKLKIMQKTNIVPLYQKLVYDKAELDKNEITIADLEIPPNAVLDLIAFDQSTEHLDLSSLQDVVSMPGDEGGFGGTGLTEEWL